MRELKVRSIINHSLCHMAMLVSLTVGCASAVDSVAEEEGISSVEEAIENGDVHPIGDAAIMNNVRFERVDGSTLGSGALLRNEWALTAAHLFPADRIANPSGTFKVRYGNELITPSEVFIAPGGLDVALVRLSIGASIGGRRTGFVRALHSGTPASLVGQTLDCWGFGANAPDGSGAGVLRQAFQRVAEAGNNWVGIERNARDQLMTTGDSGGVCFFGGQAIGVHNNRYREVNGKMTRGRETHTSAFRTWALDTVMNRKPTTIHRQVLTCDGAPIGGEQLIPGNSTGNYTCASRYYQQCIADGSFDSYYQEWCDYSTAPCRLVAPGKYFCDPGKVPAGTCRPTKVHRTSLTCSGDYNSPEEIIDLSGGYSNYTCGNRFMSQCVNDGTWDSYYSEWCEYSCN